MNHRALNHNRNCTESSTLWSHQKASSTTQSTPLELLLATKTACCSVGTCIIHDQTPTVTSSVITVPCCNLRLTTTHSYKGNTLSDSSLFTMIIRTAPLTTQTNHKFICLATPDDSQSSPHPGDTKIHSPKFHPRFHITYQLIGQ